jgi:hypothetical protein
VSLLSGEPSEQRPLRQPHTTGVVYSLYRTVTGLPSTSRANAFASFTTSSE